MYIDAEMLEELVRCCGAEEENCFTSQFAINENDDVENVKEQYQMNFLLTRKLNGKAVEKINCKCISTNLIS